MFGKHMNRHRILNRTPQFGAAVLLFAMLAAVFAADPPPDTPVLENPRPLIFDTEEPPPGYPQMNPFNTLASLNCWGAPILDSKGQPHKHGHVIQVIMDGGNTIQDQPNPDGSPGGDDSIAYGNFNMIRLSGLEEMNDTTGQTGRFMSWRYFIPYQPHRAYYLRLWEGKDVATAPFYQDTEEYVAGVDRGGALITPREGTPIDVDWKFGAPKPRPAAHPKK